MTYKIGDEVKIRFDPSCPQIGIKSGIFIVHITHKTSTVGKVTGLATYDRGWLDCDRHKYIVIINQHKVFSLDGKDFSWLDDGIYQFTEEELEHV